MEAFDLKRGLLLGVNAGGVRSDGGLPGTPWSEWHGRGRQRPGGGDAGHWAHWREDVALMRRMGLESCRLSLDWARLEPEEDVFDERAIAHVREELLLMRAVAVRPVLVLHEFSDPQWFARRGGWGRAENVDYFLRYVEKLARTVGHLVTEYVPISQANLFAVCGWYLGSWPPGRTSLLATGTVLGVLAAAHIETYQRLHEVRRELGFRDTRVGASVYMRMIRPKGGIHMFRGMGAGMVDKVFQAAMSEALILGKFSPSIRNLRHLKRGHYSDFHDLCCYALPGGLDGMPGAGREASVDEVLYCAAKLSTLLRKPLFITEGPGLTAPSPERVYEFVTGINRASLPVERYFALCFTDGANIDREGRYCLGLAAVDSHTGERSLRPAGALFAGIVRNRGMTGEMCRPSPEESAT